MANAPVVPAQGPRPVGWRTHSLTLGGRSFGTGYKRGKEHFRDTLLLVRDKTEMPANKHWIAGAIKHPGALTRRAKAHHRSLGAEIRADTRKNAHVSAHVRREANLARTLRKMHHHHRR